VLRALPLVILAAPLLVPAVVFADQVADQGQSSSAKPSGKRPEAEVVDVFTGIAQGQIEVRLIPRNSAKCNLLVTNKTDKPLSIALPRAFAGVPVLAQGMMPPFDLGADRNNSPQRVGVGPGGPMMNPMMNPMNVAPGMRGRNPGGGNPWGGPMMNVPPEKLVRMRMPCVCLDHGAPDPNPRIEYTIRPLQSCGVKDGVAEVCAMLGSGQIDQRSAQLAAWHLNNDLSWEKLAGLRQRATLGTRSVYSRSELLAGRRVADRAVELAEQEKTPTTSQTASSR